MRFSTFRLPMPGLSPTFVVILIMLFCSFDLVAQQHKLGKRNRSAGSKPIKTDSARQESYTPIIDFPGNPGDNCNVCPPDPGTFPEINWRFFEPNTAFLCSEECKFLAFGFNDAYGKSPTMVPPPIPYRYTFNVPKKPVEGLFESLGIVSPNDDFGACNGIVLSPDYNGKTFIGMQNHQTLHPGTNPGKTNNLSLTSQGYVGINTEDPQQQLHANGDFCAENTAIDGLLQVTGNAQVTGYITTTTIAAQNLLISQPATENGKILQVVNGQSAWVNPTSLSITGTPNKIAKFNASGDGAVDSDIYNEGGKVRIGLPNGPELYNASVQTVGSIRIGKNTGTESDDNRLIFSGGKAVGTGDGENNCGIWFQRKNIGPSISALQLHFGGMNDPNPANVSRLEIGHHTTNGLTKNIILHASGEIYARKVKVTLDNLNDIVFLPSYKLRSLKETEEYIQANGHLPEVPSQAEVAKDGMDVGEMNNILLKKIEEMTLHLIRMEKEIQALKKAK